MSVHHDAEVNIFDLLCMQRQQDDLTHYHIPRNILSLTCLNLKPKYQWSHSWANESHFTKEERTSILFHGLYFKGCK